MGKLTIKKQQKKHALMQSAFELFTTVGFNKTTIRDIALRAGVAKGTFYLYFNDKVDIREAVIRSTASELLQDACSSLDQHVRENPGELDVADIFIYIIDHVLEDVSRDPLLVKFLAKHLSWGLFYKGDKDKRTTDNTDDSLDIVNFVKTKLREYNVRIKDLKLLIFTLLELVSSTFHDVLLYEEPVTMEEYKPYLNNCIRLLVNNSIA